MKGLRIVLYETRRLFLARKTWVYMLVITFAPILFSANLFGIGGNYYGTMTSVIVLGPAKGAVFVAVCASLFLTLLEMQRMTKYRMNIIIETMTNSIQNQLRQTVAILIVTATSVLLSLCILIPYTMHTMGSTFRLIPFLACWIFIYFGGALIAILFSSGLYMITRSFDASFIIMGVLIGISFFAPFGSNYLLSWVQTNVLQLSDATQSYLKIDVISYTRLVWLLASVGIYMLGLSCIRRYGRNLIRSFLLSCRKVISPILFTVFVVGTVIAVKAEPFFDNGPVIKYSKKIDPDTGIVIYETDDESFFVDDSWNDVVTVESEHAKMTVDTKERLLRGEATYNISNPSGEEQDIAFTIIPGIELKEVYENDVRIDYSKNRNDDFMNSVYHIKIKDVKNTTLRIIYEGTPKSSQDSQIREWGITDEFVLIPSTYPMPKCGGGYQMDCTLNLPKNLTPIMQDTSLNEISSEAHGYRTYQYKDLGKYWLIAGEYTIQKVEAGGQEIQFIYLKGREQVMKESDSAAVIADVVDFFTEKFGPLDFQGKPFIIAELDASFVDGGWGLGNMSVFGEAMFAGNAYKGSSENVEGGSGIGVAVHEIAHQWWGWSPDSVYVTEDGASPWSSEGLTVYSTYLYMKERYGEEYARKEFTDVWEKNTRKMQNAFYLTHLKYANKLPINDAEEIYTAFATTTRYDMMPYILQKAEQMVGGEDAFLSSLKEISQKYRQKELTYEDFLRELGIEKEELQID